MADLDELFGGFGDAAAAPTAPAQPAKPPPAKRAKTAAALPPPPRAPVTLTPAVKDSSNGRNVTCFAALPADYAPPPAPPADRPPARTWPFELDGFQRKAVECVDREESVLVSAHTSAGKTVCAEYAIAAALRDGSRVVYTSPIKALSNQKFRDLQEIFGDVGLMTGDVTINPQASCLVMTTEILRSMLYRGSELVREVKWVVYDEIHYMRDAERGVVWEESIILLPHTVRFVFLSATIPNAKEFAAWICQTHRQACHVVYTDYRPTPLVHYVFASGGEGLHLVVDEQGTFREANFAKAVGALGADAADAGPKKRAGGNRQAAADLKRIVAVIRQQSWQPAIVFAFSKAQCERNAVALKDEPPFNTPDEADIVDKVFGSALEALTDDDRALPQVTTLLPLLKRGIGIHHGGLLPIVKEVVEILFQEGLLKLLFATETFAIGINMPARTVVFTETRKFDGKDFRWLSSGEYIQMSGRAGRRGKDDKGMVLQVLDEKMEPAVARGILYGEADRLDSSYHVTYNMLLNLMRVEGADPEYLVRSSFHQFQQESDAPALLAAAAAKEEAAAAIDAGDADEEDAAARRVACVRALQDAERAELAVARKASRCLPWLQPGRLAALRCPRGWKPCPEGDLGEGVIVAARAPRSGEQYDDDVEAQLLTTVVDVVVADERGARVACLPLPALRTLSAARVFLPPDLRRPEARARVMAAVAEVSRRFEGGPPALDPVRDLRLDEEEGWAALHETTRRAKADLDAAPACADTASYERRLELREAARALRKKARDVQTLGCGEELRKMRLVLRGLGHVTREGVIALKGRAACELNTADELVVAELLMDGVFTELDAPTIVALLSCLCFGEPPKDGAPTALRPALAAAREKLSAAATVVARAKVAARLTVDVDAYVAAFNPGLMEVLYQWANGAKFVDLTKLTDAFEGTLIRVIRRLDELLRQLASAAFSVGNFDLKAKFDDASARIKRDVVFAASLYL